MVIVPKPVRTRLAVPGTHKALRTTSWIEVVSSVVFILMEPVLLSSRVHVLLYYELTYFDLLLKVLVTSH